MRFIARVGGIKTHYAISRGSASEKNVTKLMTESAPKDEEKCFAMRRFL